MNFLYIVCAKLLLLQYIPLVICCPNSCQCNKDPPLKFIYQIAGHFREVQSCGYHFTATQSVSSDGVRRIHYQAELKKNESAIELCGCLHGYLSQKDWLDGSIQSCCVRKNIAKMTLEGEPDPNFDSSISPDNPLEQLERLFAQFKYGEFEKHVCRPSTREDENKNLHFHLDCDLHSDSPCKEEMCRNIMRYLNQDGWLGKMTYSCTVDGKVLRMEMMSQHNA